MSSSSNWDHLFNKSFPPLPEQSLVDSSSAQQGGEPFKSNVLTWFVIGAFVGGVAYAIWYSKKLAEKNQKIL